MGERKGKEKLKDEKSVPGFEFKGKRSWRAYIAPDFLLGVGE